MPPRRAAPAQADTPDAKKAKTKGAGALSVGDQCPYFEVRTEEDTPIKSTDLFKDSAAVLFAYPKANTPGCSKQASGFRDNYDEIKEAGYEVYGISADKPKAQSNWKEKYDLPFTLLCDTDKSALKALGFLDGDKIKRSHVVLSKEGVVEQYMFGVNPGDSVDQALEHCKAMAGNDEDEDEEDDDDEEEEEEEAGDEDDDEDEAGGDDKADGDYDGEDE